MAAPAFSPASAPAPSPASSPLSSAPTSSETQVHSSSSGSNVTNSSVDGHVSVSSMVLMSFLLLLLGISATLGLWLYQRWRIEAGHRQQFVRML
eukprot:TRINITY_DN5187_c0_g3_i1.p1 TRINITY_DN5187_c0_g3~~TRINITY_DN5187_c0_g3_i1.p1  ORF type:complete len:109 (+),score=24.82 TRINITY_DN5187_c0_g3_i1:48-329(+)